MLELVEGGSLGEHEFLRVRWLTGTLAKHAVEDDPFVGSVLVGDVKAIRPVGEDEGSLCLSDEA